ncbi:MAG: hypothetical protein IJH55_08860, partial [Romboutsia sp.]|nr:hypothetical protein [Romboutsia sp.]
MADMPNWVKNANAWAESIGKDNTFHYKKWSSDSRTHECPICKKYPVLAVDRSSSGSTTIKGLHGWNCIGFAWAVWHHGGGLPTKCNCGVINDGTANKMLNNQSLSQALATAKSKSGCKTIEVIKSSSGVPKSQWRAGDICLQYKGNRYMHTFYYMGDGKIADSTGSSGKTSPAKQVSAGKKYSSYSAKVIIRYVGPDIDGTPYIEPTSETTGTKTVVKKYSTCQKDVKDGAVAWARAIVTDNSFHYGKGNAAHHYGCYFCGTQTLKSGSGILDWEKTYCSSPFVFSAFAHGGGEKDMLTMCKAGKNSSTLIFHDNQHFRDIGLPDISSLQSGDVLWYDSSYNDSSNGCHYAIYIGNGKIAEAAFEDDNVRKSKKWNDSLRERTLSSYGSFKHVSRYIGNTFGGSIDIPGQEGLVVQVQDNGTGLDLRQAISQLYSSENFKYVSQQNEEENKTKQLTSKFSSELQSKLKNVNFNSTPTQDSNAIAEQIVTNAVELAEFEKDKPKKILQGRATQLLSYPTLVEAPTIVLDFNGIRIGGYGNTGDKYPNYLTSMTVNKINGRINRYTINLTYQVRFGEDPNFIDKLISRTGYTNPLKILYGDSNYPRGYYKEESAVIMDVRHSEDSSAYRISYNITALSSIGASQASLTTFESKQDKPSNIIYKLLYDSGEISKSLIDLFPGMRNKTLVASKNLIPTNDTIVQIGGMSNVSPLTYLSYLVACMSSASNNSTYFLNLIDNSNNEFDGSYFEIKEVINYNNRDTTDINIASNYYELDIGYPSNNFITNFQICSNNYWSLVYEYAGNIPKFQYGIDDNGDLISRQTNALYTTDKYNDSSLISSNWWRQVT